MTARVAVLLEYDFSTPIVDDPGDNYDFVTNHLFAAGVRF